MPYPKSVLMYTCMGKSIYDLQLSKELIIAGANLDLQDNYGNTALMFACNGIKTQHIQMLIKAGASINKQNNKGETALMLICQQNVNDKLQTIQELIEAGANVNLRDNKNYTALSHLLDNNTKMDCEKIFSTDYATFIDKKNISVLLRYSTQNKCHWILDRIMDFHKSDEDIMLQLLPHMSKIYRMYWYKYKILNEDINKNVSKYKNHLYEKPGNIICMIGEVLFYRAQMKYNVPNKLKFLFDIKGQIDCVEKINFYL